MDQFIRESPSFTASHLVNTAHEPPFGKKLVHMNLSLLVMHMNLSLLMLPFGKVASTFSFVNPFERVIHME
jgi:hypothetical protein